MGLDFLITGGGGGAGGRTYSELLLSGLVGLRGSDEDLCLPTTSTDFQPAFPGGVLRGGSCGRVMGSVLDAGGLFITVP